MSVLPSSPFLATFFNFTNLPCQALHLTPLVAEYKALAQRPMPSPLQPSNNSPNDQMTGHDLLIRFRPPNFLELFEGTPEEYHFINPSILSSHYTYAANNNDNINATIFIARRSRISNFNLTIREFSCRSYKVVCVFCFGRVPHTVETKNS